MHLNKRFSNFGSPKASEIGTPLFKNTFLNGNSTPTQRFSPTDRASMVPRPKLVETVQQKKVLSRKNYIRGSKKIWVSKSRSKTVRGAKVTTKRKRDPTVDPINRCIIKDIAVENWTGYSINNPFKVNQDSYII